MFRDRRDAGEQLAALLTGYRGRPGVVLLALPRGGVPVAGEVSHALALPLDVLPVRKIGAPGEPELAIGAVAENELVVLDKERIVAMRLSQSQLETAIAHEREELVRRERMYRGDRSPLALAGQIAILVDDGLATGYTMLAAVRAVRLRQASRVVVAVPVAPQSTLDRLRTEADEVFCAYTPANLMAVGQYYEDFGQVSDEQVREELSRSASV